MQETMYRPQKINSFNMPISYSQIISYFIVLAQIIVYFTCIFSNLQIILQRIIMTVIYLCLTIGLIIIAFLVSYSDPSDQIVTQYKIAIAQKKEFIDQNYYYCNYCESYCSQTSKHCKTCQRCVKKFDHHCIWINNCIGEANYNIFLVMIVFAEFNLIAFVSAGILFSLEKKFSSHLAQLVIIWIFMFINLIALMFLTYLILLHIYLIYLGITTFQFFKKQKLQKSNQLRQFHKKVSEMNARQQGNDQQEHHQQPQIIAYQQRSLSNQDGKIIQATTNQINPIRQEIVIFPNKQIQKDTSQKSQRNQNHRRSKKIHNILQANEENNYEEVKITKKQLSPNLRRIIKRPS